MQTAQRGRAIINEASRPLLPKYVRLRFDSVRGRTVVLSPEKVFWPDEISIEILKLCDGQRSVGAIADTLSAEYNAPREVIFADVLEFTQEWSDNLLLKTSSSKRLSRSGSLPPARRSACSQS